MLLSLGKVLGLIVPGVAGAYAVLPGQTSAGTLQLEGSLGFVFGDGVYEVLRVVRGRFFAADFHNERLKRSLAGIRIELPLAQGRLWHN